MPTDYLRIIADERMAELRTAARKARFNREAAHRGNRGRLGRMRRAA